MEWDLNPRGTKPADLKSAPLDLSGIQARVAACRLPRSPRLVCPIEARPSVSSHTLSVFVSRRRTYRSYHAGVSSDRTNLSPFTKDYRGLALQCDLAVFRAPRGAHYNKKKTFYGVNTDFCE